MASRNPPWRRGGSAIMDSSSYSSNENSDRVGKPNRVEEEEEEEDKSRGQVVCSQKFPRAHILDRRLVLETPHRHPNGSSCNARAVARTAWDGLSSTSIDSSCRCFRSRHGTVLPKFLKQAACTFVWGGKCFPYGICRRADTCMYPLKGTDLDRNLPLATRPSPSKSWDGKAAIER